MPAKKTRLAQIGREITRLEALRWDAQRQSDAESVGILQNEISAYERERDQLRAPVPRQRRRKPATLTREAGDCFRWAAKYVMAHRQAVLVHGTIVSPDFPFLGRIAHAWAEDGDRVLDWQCIVAGQGGPYAGRGYPRDYFYAAFSPESMTEYRGEEVHVTLLRAGHWGPWE